MADQIPEIDCAELHSIYMLVDEMRADEVAAARGILAAYTRLRKKMAQVSRLCKDGRKALLAATVLIRETRKAEKGKEKKS